MSSAHGSVKQKAPGDVQSYSDRWLQVLCTYPTHPLQWCHKTYHIPGRCETCSEQQSRRRYKVEVGLKYVHTPYKPLGKFVKFIILEKKQFMVWKPSTLNRSIRIKRVNELTRRLAKKWDAWAYQVVNVISNHVRVVYNVFYSICRTTFCIRPLNVAIVGLNAKIQVYNGIQVAHKGVFHFFS